MNPLFPTRTGRRLTRDAVERRVAIHVASATLHCPSLAGKDVHPHVLRHSCAMSLLQARVDSTVIALWLGHYAGARVKCRARSAVVAGAGGQRSRSVRGGVRSAQA